MRKELLTRAPYYLMIRTDSYTGNFERELVGYVFGMSDKFIEENYGRGREYCMEFYEEDMKGNPLVQDTIENRFLYQEVRDKNYIQFYDITSHPSNEKWNCDSLIILLNEPFCKTDTVAFDYEAFVIDRIKKFFTDSRIRECKRLYGQSPDNRWYSNPYDLAVGHKLLSIELYDTRQDKLIKKYDIGGN